MFEQDNAGEPRNAITDWVLRGGVAFAFALFGAEKFHSGPGCQWVKLFEQIGFGQSFRYFTGVVEILGGVLVLIPWTAPVGLALLATTTAGAALILDFVVGRPGDTIISTGFFRGLAAFWWARRKG
jgi:uncharacterized membrane protein YphA (DoxX/SURF4 family)